MAIEPCGGGEKTKINWLQIVVGVILIVFGLRRVTDPTVPHYGYEIDVSPFNTPLAAVSIGIGGYFLWSALSSIKDDDIDTVACQKCGESINLKEFKGEKCPSCGNELPRCDD